MELCHALRIPEKMVGLSRVSWTGLEGLLVVLRRLSYPCRLGELSDEFGRSLPDLSRIFNSTLMWIWRRWSGQVQDPFTKAHFTPARLRADRAAIYRKSGVDLRIWGFIDGTVRPMCRPRVHQRMFYNEHKRVHALKFQAVTTPDGLICHLYGPVVGSRHDAGVLAESGLLPQLQQHMQLPAGPPYALFGDPAYPLSPHLQKAYAGAALTQQQTTLNTDMAAVRQSVEWSLGDITVMWAFVDFKKNLKIGWQPLALYYMVAALLTNWQLPHRGVGTGGQGGGRPSKKIGTGAAPPPNEKHRKAQKNDESALRAARGARRAKGKACNTYSECVHSHVPACSHGCPKTLYIHSVPIIFIALFLSVVLLRAL